jgi:hypothetical protein
LPIAVVAVATLAVGACTAPAPQPTEYGSKSTGPKGLRRSKADGPKAVYVRPGARLDRYSEVIVDPFMISYKRGPQPTGSEPQPIRTLDHKTEEKLADAMRDAFVGALRRSRHFSLVQQPGPKTLHIQGWIFDLVVGDPKVHRRDMSICFAEMRLVLTARSAQTAEALALVTQKFTTHCERRNFLDSLRWEDITRAMEPWARILRDQLDALHELEPTPLEGRPAE